MPRILVVDDEPAVRRVVRRALAPLQCDVVQAGDGREAIELLGGDTFDVVITDLGMPRADGYAVLREARKRPTTQVIMLTGQGTVDDSVRALREGAFNFLTKPFHPQELADVVREALADRPGAPGAGERPLPGRPTQPQVALLGTSPLLRAVLDAVEAVAPTDASVLLTGETGTGKEIVARLIHGLSRRAGGPFVAVNCGAIPESLAESELFGHGRGAFTGASERRTGKFVLADGGSLFLDEVGELPAALQVKLLRALQEREVTPLGETKPIRVDLRVIAATHRDLEEMVAARTFREDLYYRLSVVPIETPPLRERAEDVPLLARHFLDMACRRLGRQVTLADEAVAVLAAYRWPGNVRELENLIENLVIMARGDKVIEPAALPRKVRGAGAPGMVVSVPSVGPQGIDLGAVLAELEARLIDEAMRLAEGNRQRASELLGIKRTTLVEKLKRR